MNIFVKNIGKEFSVANNIMENSFLIGCNHGLNEKHILILELLGNNYLKFYGLINDNSNKKIN